MQAFARFGPGHLIALAVIVLTASAAVRLGHRPGLRPYVRWGLVTILVASTAAFFLGEAIGGTLSGWDFLPFHLSDFAVLLAIFALATLRRRAAELLYFLSISALFALATPDLDRGFGDWQTNVFFILHGAVLVSAVALTLGFGLAPQRGAVVRALVFVNSYALFAAALNRLLGTNFLYLSRKPSQPSPLDWMGGWPWYILSAEVLAAALFALAYLPFGRREESSMRRHLLPLARRAAVACVPTADNVKGPAYRAGAPFRDHLCPPDEPGEPLTVTGTVTSAGDCEPLAGALLDVWQTDARGRYSNLLGLADPTKPGAFRLRGRLRSDEQGRYRFVSVLPGHYPLWIFTRPRHVHFMVSRAGYRTLVTQLYFAGDPYLSADPWVESSLVVVPSEETRADGRRRWQVAFDLVLERL